MLRGDQHVKAADVMQHQQAGVASTVTPWQTPDTW